MLIIYACLLDNIIFANSGKCKAVKQCNVKAASTSHQLPNNRLNSSQSFCLCMREARTRSDTLRLFLHIVIISTPEQFGEP